MKKTSKTSSSLAVIDTANLPAVPNTLDLLRDELKGLKEITETSYKTEGNVEGFSTNIQNETKIDVLIKMHSSIAGRAQAFNASSARLQSLVGIKLESPLFKINGNTIEALENDIVLRIKVISVSERKAELDALVKEGENFLTEKDKYGLYLEKVAKATTRK